jgi:putative FmdB family regulatory protein
MPTYDYDCADCGHTFEYFQSITASPLELCPKCNGRVYRRINGGAGLIFKGSGFYLTDYKRATSGTSKGDGDTAKKAGSEKGVSEKKEKTTAE